MATFRGRRTYDCLHDDLLYEIINFLNTQDFIAFRKCNAHNTAITNKVCPAMNKFWKIQTNYKYSLIKKSNFDPTNWLNFYRTLLEFETDVPSGDKLLTNLNAINKLDLIRCSIWRDNLLFFKFALALYDINILDNKQTIDILVRRRRRRGRSSSKRVSVTGIFATIHYTDRRNNNLNILKWILAKPGIKLDIVEKNGLTLIMEASKQGLVEPLRLLLKEDRMTKEIINYQEKKSLMTAFHMSIFTPAFDVLMKEHKVDVNLEANDGRTPLLTLLDNIAVNRPCNERTKWIKRAEELIKQKDVMHLKDCETIARNIEGKEGVRILNLLQKKKTMKQM